MGRDVDKREGGRFGRRSVGFECLFRRKQVDNLNRTSHDGQQLAKTLSAFDLISIGVGSTIGAGVYILVGTVARELTGPALTFSFLIAGIAAGLSALCYAELACRCPSAGSAYHYSYVCVGEGVAWLIGWALILEYTLGAAAVARGIFPNMALFFGGVDKLPAFLARQTILGIIVDPSAAILVIIVTGLLCTGIRESSLAQAIVTTINICALVFVIIAGSYLGFKTGWIGYQVPTGYSPFGVNGVLAGSATVFFSYVGFDAVTSTAEEVKSPQRDLPLGIGISLSICCLLYMLVSIVIVGIVPYNALDPDTPISSAFASYGMEWAVYIVATGTITALIAAMIGGILPQPRVMMAMARDGLLPTFFSDINKHTQVPVKGTIWTGLFVASLAFFMDVSQLAGMVSVGTLLAFTAVAISVLILRYISPEEVSVPSTVQESNNSSTLQFSSDNDIQESKNLRDTRHPLIQKSSNAEEQIEVRRRKIAAWSIALACVGVLVLVSAASADALPRIPRFTLCGVGAVLLLCCLIVLTSIDQDDARQRFGHTGGFVCPFVPLLPGVCILVNAYLLIHLGGGTWIRVSIWLAAGAVVYIFYGRTHSSLAQLDSAAYAHHEEEISSHNSLYNSFPSTSNA